MYDPDERTTGDTAARRRRRHVTRATRRQSRRVAVAAIRRGDYDAMASGERMVRRS